MVMPFQFQIPDVMVPVKWWLIYLRCLIVNCGMDVVDLLG